MLVAAAASARQGLRETKEKLVAQAEAGSAVIKLAAALLALEAAAGSALSLRRRPR